MFLVGCMSMGVVWLFFWEGCPFHLGVVFILGGGRVHVINFGDGLLLLEGWGHFWVVVINFYMGLINIIM